MKDITIDQLRERVVEEGETVRVLRDGVVVARIVPVEGWESKTPAWKYPPEIRLSLGDVSLSERIVADRDDRL